MVIFQTFRRIFDLCTKRFEDINFTTDLASLAYVDDIKKTLRLTNTLVTNICLKNDFILNYN